MLRRITSKKNKGIRLFEMFTIVHLCNAGTRVHHYAKLDDDGELRNI